MKNKIALKGGTYSLIISVVVLAIMVVINLLASVLPSTATKLDISSQQLYSITSNTKVVVNNLDRDVTVYWVVQADEEDSVVENLLAKYEALSDHITVVKKNPDTYPTFTAAYTDESVTNNSLIVECGTKYRYIPYEDIYPTDIDYTTYSYVYSFDGEGAVTSAIDYVVSDELPQLYVLEGHGESELPAEFSEQIEKENMEVTSFSLLNEDSVPEEADCVLLYAPTSDLSEEEQKLLSEYAENGGKLMVVAGPTEEGSLENLNAILSGYGVEAAEGIVLEEDRTHYAFQQPYCLLPDIQSSDITDPLIEGNYYIIMPITQGLDVSAAGSSVTALLTTSDTAFSKQTGFAMTTYEKEENDADGPFALAVSIQTSGGGEIIWVSSPYFLEETYNAYSSGANLNFAMNALSELIGEREAVSIRSKSLAYNYLTITESQGTFLKAIMMIVLPAAFIVAGIVVFSERRRRSHE